MAAINQAPQSSALGRSISSGSSEIRGEVAAPGMPSEEMSDFTEGSGLLADTIRKVNSSFFVRLNQMTGSSDDMGYKYFVEKVSTSVCDFNCEYVEWNQGTRLMVVSTK